MADITPWLKALDFEEKPDLYELKVKGSTIIIDIDNEKIRYPKLKEIGRDTTTNFSAEENFVVLEAIIGLLNQGYTPNQISIEKGYKLGHNTKSGNADITVEDNEGKPFLIIEVKTYGSEFNKEWKNTLNDGGQLFSYEKQDNKAQVLVLYASQVNSNNIERIYHAIILKDNQDFLLTLENPRGYKDAKGGNDKFEIWRDTYQQNYVTNGVLEPTIEVFKFGKVKSSTDDLKEITHDEVQKKYNQFATILRKYNVGGRENAFDKLVNLFLAKIVDEQQHSDDLQFNWKGVAQDTYFELVDRLQKLYQVGMEKFLGEKVSYVAEKDVENAFRLRKDAAKDAILKYFKELKYFSNNDFTFLDVYNEQLFYHNSKILVEIVQMLQDMKLKTKEQNQFLGDLFEGFLDNGVKQSEGQFFTPLPIVKFIVSSLPLEEINKQTDIPKVIDYACGAGHFLNEYAEQLKRFVDEKKLPEYYSEIHGIEKEYRLSKVAKVSAFMYGQDDINIIYGDALTEHDGVDDNSYSVIIANPPYSVKGFLETLSGKQREKYELSRSVDKLDTNNSIELFFLERAEQLLKSQGVAGIIVPTSVLSNGNIYSKSRKMLIENFDIIAIAEFGSKTFGSTGTNTITLFLRKKKYPPKESDNYKYAVERWFTNTDVQQSDVDIVQSYCDTLGFEYEDYLELQNGQIDKLFEVELFEEYVEEFIKSTIAKNVNKKKITKKYTQADKNTEFQKAQFAYIKEIEQEKVAYFALSDAQENEVVIVKSPNADGWIKMGYPIPEEAKARKKRLNELYETDFLGYGWSKRKGQEGIKYIGANISDEEMEVSKNQAINSIQTPLFNPLNLADNEKINSVIRDNFNGNLSSIPTSIDSFVSTSALVDMLDFTQTSFDSQIKTIPDQKIELASKYDQYKIEHIAESVFAGGDAPSDYSDQKTAEYQYPIYSNGTGDRALYGYSKTAKVINHPAITISARGTIGYVMLVDEPFTPIVRLITIVPKTDIIEIKYLKEVLNILPFGNTGGLTPQLTVPNFKKTKVPIPPKNVQKKIIEEVENLDKKYQSSRMKIEDYRKQITKIFQSLDILGGATYRLSSKDFTIMIGKRVLNRELTQDGIPVYSANVFEPFGKIDKDIVGDFSKPSVLWGIDGDWMVNIIPANQPFYPTDHAGVLRVNTAKINYRYLAHRLEQEGIREGFSRSYRASIEQIEKLSVVIPDISKQNDGIKQIEKIEEKIASEQSIINETQELKKVILEKYLN